MVPSIMGGFRSCLHVTFVPDTKQHMLTATIETIPSVSDDTETLTCNVHMKVYPLGSMKRLMFSLLRYNQLKSGDAIADMGNWRLKGRHWMQI